MRRMGGFYRHGPGPALILLLTPLLIAAATLWWQHYHDDLDDARRAAESEFQIVTSVLTNNIQKKNYQVIDSLLKEWGANSPDIVEAKASRPSGKYKGEMQSASTANC
jgi:hypothetical protein